MVFYVSWSAYLPSLLHNFTKLSNKCIENKYIGTYNWNEFMITMILILMPYGTNPVIKDQQIHLEQNSHQILSIKQLI